MGLTNPEEFHNFINDKYEKYSEIYLNILKYSKKFDKKYETIFFNAHNYLTLQNTILLAPIKSEDNSEIIDKKIRMVNDFSHVKAFYDIILDNPWETDEDIIETLIFLSKLPTPFEVSGFSLVFFPGTALYRKAKEEGIVKDDLNDVYRKYFREPKKTYFNALFFLLKNYCVVGVGISPKLMYYLTHKMTRRLHLHWISLKIIKALFPFFRTLGRKIRKSTRIYKTGWNYITQNKGQLGN